MHIDFGKFDIIWKWIC